MTARARFVQLATSKLGATVLWGRRGPDVFDCSGLVAWALHAVGGRNLIQTHNAQMMSDETPQEMRRLACWLIGHRWFVLDDSCHRSWVLGHLHIVAGCLAMCERCGENWDDRCGRCP